MNYRGPLRVRIDEKPMPEILHPQDAIVRVTRSCICGSNHRRDLAFERAATRHRRSRHFDAARRTERRAATFRVPLQRIELRPLAALMAADRIGVVEGVLHDLTAGAYLTFSRSAATRRSGSTTGRVSLRGWP